MRCQILLAAASTRLVQVVQKQSGLQPASASDERGGHLREWSVNAGVRDRAQATLRNAQQAASADGIARMDALGIGKAAVAGIDGGARTADVMTGALARAPHGADQPSMNASRSALICAAWVTGIPCGYPG